MKKLTTKQRLPLPSSMPLILYESQATQKLHRILLKQKNIDVTIRITPQIITLPGDHSSHYDDPQGAYSALSVPMGLYLTGRRSHLLVPCGHSNDEANGNHQLTEDQHEDWSLWVLESIGLDQKRQEGESRQEETGECPKKIGCSV